MCVCTLYMYILLLLHYNMILYYCITLFCLIIHFCFLLQRLPATTDVHYNNNEVPVEVWIISNKIFYTEAFWNVA